MPIGDVMLQWGQNTISTDSAKAFPFVEPFGGTCAVALTNTARPDIQSALSVSARAAGTFTINRDDAVDYTIPFHWLALGGAPGTTGSQAGHVIVGDVMLQWGRCASTSDDSQTFTMASPFGSGTVAVVVTSDEANIRSSINVTSVNAAAGTFKVDRDAAIDGTVYFTYLAIGPAPGKTLASPILRVQDFMLQWGKATSSSDDEQLFLFPQSYATMNFSVIATVNEANVKSGLSMSRPIHEGGFIIDRDSVVDGSHSFYWVAAGR